MTGLAGIPLFYAQMDRLDSSNSRVAKIYDVLEKIFVRINNGDFIITYSSGIIGVAYMLDLLAKEKIIDSEDVEEHLIFFDNLIIEKSLEAFTNSEHIDFLHGRLGAANYFLERNVRDPSLQEKVNELFYKIADVVDNETSKTKQVEHLNQYDDLTHRTNCGLAHGHASTILIFTKYLKSFPDDERILLSLKNSIECLLSFQSKDPKKLASFPGIAVNPKTASYNLPLGWCYGDQTIAFSLAEASIVLSSESLAQIAQEIAKKTSKRNTLETALSKDSDAAFCHGVASLAYMNKVFYQKYSHEDFANLYHKFTKVVLSKGNDSEGIAGYRKYLGNYKYESSIGLLDGTIGIGLFLSDSIMAKEQQINWQSCFLLR